MLRKALLLPALLLGFLGTACIAPKSYVDPALGSVDRAQIKRDTTPLLYLTVHFQTNGEAKPKVDSAVLQKLKTQLLATGAIQNIKEGQGTDGPHLEFTMNNVADKGDATAKGIGTGLTFGLAGNMVTDGYVFTVVLERQGQDPIRKEYKHAIHTTIGNHDGPPGLQPMTTGEAVDRVIEQVAGHIVADLQQQNAI